MRKSKTSQLSNNSERTGGGLGDSNDDNDKDADNEFEKSEFQKLYFQ